MMQAIQQILRDGGIEEPIYLIAGNIENITGILLTPSGGVKGRTGWDWQSFQVLVRTGVNRQAQEAEDLIERCWRILVHWKGRVDHNERAVTTIIGGTRPSLLETDANNRTSIVASFEALVQETPAYGGHREPTID